MSNSTSDCASTAQSTWNSTKDKQLFLTLKLKEISAKLSNVATELTELHHLLLDPSSSNRQKPSALTLIKATFIPFICAASVKISASANNLSPIYGASYVHKRNEARRNSETELNENCEKQREISSLKRIENAVAKTSPHQVSININDPILKTMRASQRQKIIPTLISSLPQPINEIYYPPLEVISILSPLPKHSKTRFKIVNFIIKENKVPVRKSAIYKILR